MPPDRRVVHGRERAGQTERLAIPRRPLPARPAGQVRLAQPRGGGAPMAPALPEAVAPRQHEHRPEGMREHRVFPVEDHRPARPHHDIGPPEIAVIERERNPVAGERAAARAAGCRCEAAEPRALGARETPPPAHGVTPRVADERIDLAGQPPEIALPAIEHDGAARGSRGSPAEGARTRAPRASSRTSVSGSGESARGRRA